MSSAQLESIADARRARELARIRAEKERVNRVMAMGVIGNNGTPRPATQTAQLEHVLAGLDSRANQIQALTGDDLVAEYVPEAA
jgi:hypothetical protein